MKKNVVIVFIFLSFSWILGESAHTEYLYEVPKRVCELIDQGEFEKAREELTKLRRKQPDNPLLLFYLAQIEKDYNRALWIYKEVERLTEGRLAAEALFKRAEMVFSRENIAEAKGLYERLIEVYPESKFYCDAYYRLGMITLAEGAPEEAMEYFRTCLVVDSDGTNRLLATAGVMECYVVLKDWNHALETALDVLEEKDEVSSVTPRVLEVIALSWRKLGNGDNANKFTERLLKNYPYSYQAHAIREEGKSIAGNAFYLRNSEVALWDSVKTEETGGDSKIAEERAKFSVQAAAFKERTNALKLFRSLKDAELDARIEMRTVRDEHFFIVRVGYFMTREDTEKMVKRVSEITGEKANVVILE